MLFAAYIWINFSLILYQARLGGDGGRFGPRYTLILNNLFYHKTYKAANFQYFPNFYLESFHENIFLSLPPFWVYYVILKIEFLKKRLKKKLIMKIRVIHCLPHVFNIDDVIKLWNTTWNKGLSHYYSNKKVKFRQTKIENEKICWMMTSSWWSCL